MPFECPRASRVRCERAKPACHSNHLPTSTTAGPTRGLGRASVSTGPLGCLPAALPPCGPGATATSRCLCLSCGSWTNLHGPKPLTVRACRPRPWHPALSILSCKPVVALGPFILFCFSGRALHMWHRGVHRPVGSFHGRLCPPSRAGGRPQPLGPVWAGVCSQAGSPGQCWLGSWHEVTPHSWMWGGSAFPASGDSS